MTTTARPVSQLTNADGLVLAPVRRGGHWKAVRALRSAMRVLREEGLAPRAISLVPLSADGRIANLGDPDLSVLVLGYALGASRGGRARG